MISFIAKHRGIAALSQTLPERDKPHTTPCSAIRL